MTTEIEVDRFTQILMSIAEVKGIVSSLVEKDTTRAKDMSELEKRVRALESTKSNNSGALTVVALIISVFGASIASNYFDKGTVTIQQPNIGSVQPDSNSKVSQ
jgi:hypothetical protein